MRTTIVLCSLGLVLGLGACRKDTTPEPAGEEVEEMTYQLDRADIRQVGDLADLDARRMLRESVSGTGVVSQRLSDRAFYVGEGTDRLLVVMRDDRPTYDAVNVTEGMQLRLTGVLVPGRHVDERSVMMLDPALEEMAEVEGHALLVHTADAVVLYDPRAGRVTERARRQPMHGFQVNAGTFDQLDRDRNRRLYRDEVASWVDATDLHAALDTDMDGRLERDELGQSLMVMLDADDDQRLTRREFREGLLGGSFATWDVDGDGYVEQSEVRQRFGERTFAAYWDTDRSGSVSRAELRRGVFDAIDTDHDSVVEMNEWNDMFLRAAPVGEMERPADDAAAMPEEEAE